MSALSADYLASLLGMAMALATYAVIMWDND